MVAERGTDLKGKRLFRPRWITIESLANVKGMSVILHGLRPPDFLDMYTCTPVLRQRSQITLIQFE